MRKQTTSTTRNRYGRNDTGKSVLISFPAHETHLIEELERLAHLEMTTKSQFLRRCIRRESQKAEEQIGQRYATV